MTKLNITWRIVLGMVLGIITGYFIHENLILSPEAGANFALLSKIFLRLIKMIIGPLVFSMLVVGIAKLGDFKQVGRIGAKTLGYFYLATILSLVVGLLVVNVMKPGEVMDLKLPEKGVETGIEAKKLTLSGFLEHVFPQSFFEALATNEILQIVVFSIFFGIGVGAIGERGKVIIKALDAVSHVMFKIVGYVMQFAPFGVFGAITAVVAREGLGIFVGYAYLILSFFIGLLFFLFVVLWGFASWPRYLS